MYGRNLFLVCFFSMAKAGNVEGAKELVYMWGPSPFKYNLNYQLKFRSVFPDFDVEVRCMDHKQGMEVGAINETRLIKKSRTTHICVKEDPEYTYSVEGDLNVTGSKEALDLVKLNGQPLALRDVSAMNEDDTIYARYSGVNADPS